MVNPESGLTAPYISRDDLLANKRAASRAKDIADVEAILEAAPALRRGQDPNRQKSRGRDRTD
jgi:hypothetical protein